jgi:hypothetical protein
MTIHRMCKALDRGMKITHRTLLGKLTANRVLHGQELDPDLLPACGVVRF